MPDGIATSPAGRGKSAPMQASVRMRRGVEDAAPYICPPKVRRTFNFMSPFLGEGGEGDGVSQCGDTPLSVSAARCHLSRRERQERSNAGVAAHLGSPFGGAVTEGD